MHDSERQTIAGHENEQERDHQPIPCPHFGEEVGGQQQVHVDTDELVAGRGLMWRSWYRASCLRRQRFSAAKATDGRRHSSQKHAVFPSSASSVHTTCTK